VEAVVNAVAVQGTHALHVAIIMDGNGRWAAARGLPRVEGHRQGAFAVRRIVEAAPSFGIRTLTLYAFSADNWRRPPAEVSALMSLFGDYLRTHEAHCIKAGVRVVLVGRRDRLPASVRRSADHIEATTASGEKLFLRLAIDYSARESIWRAAERSKQGGCTTRQEFAALVAGAEPDRPAPPDVDLLVRTGGERRLSDFLLWESAYAELWFTDTPWPDFSREHLARALQEFACRDRRFGGLDGARSAEEVRV
jgi:undecaprenyl diphosphate synthase